MTWLAYSHLGVAKTVQLTTQPAVALAGIAFGVQPVGRLVDGSGVLSRATGVTVTASKSSGTGTLSGTLSVQTVEGVFTFTDLKMDTVTSAVTLQFASSGLTSAVSNAFNVTQPNTIIGCEVGTYAVTGTAQTLIRGPYMMRQDTVGSYVLTGTAATLTGPSTFTDDGTYIRTWEPVDADTLLADDFSTGDWYSIDGDHSNDGALTHGWIGTIYANPITPAGAIVGGGVGLHGRPYAATSGYRNGSAGGRNMAWHWFKTQGQSDVYFRIYFQAQSDYIGGHEKMFELMDDESNTGWIIMGCNNTFGSNRLSGLPFNHQDGGLGGQGPTDPSWMPANVAPAVTIQNGHWYYFEQRMALNTPGQFNGIYENWMDDCGVDGRSGPSVPTKRASYTNVLWRDSSETAVRIGGIWIENWANPGSTGTMYYANVYCSRRFVGFADPTWQG